MVKRNDFAGMTMSPRLAEQVAQFDYGNEIICTGGAGAEHNWLMLLEHTSAEWAGDLDATMATMTRNDPFQIMYATGLNVHGWDNVREFYAKRLQTFSGQGFLTQRMVVSDTAAVGTGYFSGTPQGQFFGIEATGKAICLPMTVWIYFEDGLVKGESAYLDGHELRHQLVHGTTRKPDDMIW
jgi:predicted ester cyclase